MIIRISETDATQESDRPLPLDFTNNNSSRWRRSLRGDRDQSGQLGNERKGWMGYKVELFSDNGPVNAISIAEGTLSVKKGCKFCIDSAILGSKWLPGEGFVMGSTVSGEGKGSTPVVQVGARHVTCMPDAALFIALSAAIDLSMDACKLFSHKLRKELCPDVAAFYLVSHLSTVTHTLTVRSTLSASLLIPNG
ncbi:hypothetical protein TSUD_75020 [Trifolium subterraneum]|nr:hypothetical protein TSUD_75020 [Trifolium subterraneum]